MSNLSQELQAAYDARSALYEAMDEVNEIDRMAFDEELAWIEDEIDSIIRDMDMDDDLDVEY